MADARTLTTEDFDRLLVDCISDVLDDYGIEHLFGWPGFKETLSAAFEDDIQERWAQEQADLVHCKFCHEPTNPDTAHWHQGAYVGDACCWDARLEATA